ncbi:MAG: DUF4159 domain-containing protein, partial [Thermoguttaceae bacterium]
MLRLYVLFLCVLFSLISSHAFGQILDTESEAAQVNEAIDQAVRFLKSRQLADGSWDDTTYKVGASALCTLALISSGLKKDDPAVSKALVFLRKYSPDSKEMYRPVYSVSLQTMVFSLADPQRDKALIRKNVDWLQKQQNSSDKMDNLQLGGWGYGNDPGYADISNTQFAILALYEAERVGVTCDPKVWQLAKTYVENMQTSEGRMGGWGYSRTSRSATGSLTCGGLASLIIAAGMVDQGSAFAEGNDIYCCLDGDTKDAINIRRGFAWMESNFSTTTNPKGGNSWLYYYLYGVERVGRMTGHRFIGNKDWYRNGAESLLKFRMGKTHWAGSPGESDLIATSFALLFLSKGRRPILLSKIQYGEDGSWNAHPQDINHLTQFVEKQWKMDMTWQTIDWELATEEDLLQSPVLYICGNQNPLMRDREKADVIVAKLRKYLDLGGFIFAEAYQDDETFDAGFRALMKRVLPEDDYEFRLLEEDHPIWSAEIPVATNQIRPIEGIDFGCQTRVVY